jgi:hypothetical protein
MSQYSFSLATTSRAGTVISSNMSHVEAEVGRRSYDPHAPHVTLQMFHFLGHAELNMAL